MRINKYLSFCGLGARRKVEDYIRNGRVTINGEILKSLSYLVNIDSDIVEMNGRRIQLVCKFYYLILNKPRGYITSMNDPEGRPVAIDLIPERYRALSIYPVGRLNKETEGLLLFTNNGDMAYKLSHPRFGVIKEYFVVFDRFLTDSDKIRIEKGIYIDGKRTNPARIVFPNKKNRSYISIKISEGKKRQIRISFERFGYRVKSIKRVAFGPLKLTGINTGSFRILKEKEIKALKKVIGNNSEGAGS